jgi:DNA-binding CsgD family transcriptional regulator
MTSTDADVGLEGRRKSSDGARGQGTGILLFSAARQLLFMNQCAQQQLSRMLDGPDHGGVRGVLPLCVIEVCHVLLEAVKHSVHPKDMEHLHLERLVDSAGRRFLLRGLCVPEEPLGTQSRLIVLIDQVDESIAYPTADRQSPYRLTEREQMVVIYLMLGFTNKEIANRIGLSEYTVKEHIKRIMHKTGTTTRTGLLAKLIFSPAAAPTARAAAPAT